MPKKKSKQKTVSEPMTVFKVSEGIYDDYSSDEYMPSFMENDIYQQNLHKTEEIFTDEAETETHIQKKTEEPPHYFAKTKSWSRKKPTKEKIAEDPFAMLADCYRFTASKEMKHIKDSLKDMEKLMSSPIPFDKVVFSSEQQRCVTSYNIVIENCNIYLDKRKSPITSNGKKRKQIIEGIKSYCEDELNKFEIASKDVFNNVIAYEPARWIDVLSKARTINTGYNNLKTETISEFPREEIYESENKSEKRIFKKAEKFENLSNKEHLREFLKADRFRHINDIVKNSPDDIMSSLEEYVSMIGKKDEIFSSNDDIDELIDRRVDQYNILDYLDEVFEHDKYPDEYDKLRQCIWDPAKESDDQVRNLKEFIDLMNEIRKKEAERSFCEEVGIKKGATLAYNDVALSRIAKLLGIPDVVPESVKVENEYGELGSFTQIIGEKERDIEEDAKAHNKEVVYSDDFTSLMPALKILGLICGKKFFDGYRYTVNRNTDPWEITNVMITDNKYIFGEMDFKKRIDYLPDIAKIDKAFDIIGYPLMSLSPELLRHTLLDLLPKSAIDAAIERLEQIQEVVINEINRKKNRD